MKLPSYVTFTGADNPADIESMHKLANDYPVEWGILLSPKRAGMPRYPDPLALQKFMRSGLDMSAHLCGGYARGAKGVSRGYEVEENSHYFLNAPETFGRIQINGKIEIKERGEAFDDAKVFAMVHNARPVLQWEEGEFPEQHPGVDLLFDRSGGTGVASDYWPTHPGYFVGYAGGIRYENVRDVITAINETSIVKECGPYWLDIETGARDDEDRFSVEICRAICTQIFDRRFPK